MSKLPKKLSALITVAVDDLIKVERSPKYNVNMGEWHKPIYKDFNSICSVCFAGAVMAKTLKVDPYQHIDGIEFYPDEYEKDCFGALDSLAGYAIDGAVFDFYYPLKFTKEQEDVIHNLDRTLNFTHGNYHEFPVQFKLNMRTIARNLKKVGL